MLIAPGHLETSAIFNITVYFLTLNYLHIPKRVKGMSVGDVQLSGTYSQEGQCLPFAELHTTCLMF